MGRVDFTGGDAGYHPADLEGRPSPLGQRGNRYTGETVLIVEGDGTVSIERAKPMVISGKPIIRRSPKRAS